MLHFVTQVNRRLLWLNLLLLLSVVFIPFPTSLLATGFNNPLAVRIYGLSLIATNASGLFIWLYAISHRELMIPNLSGQFARTVIVIHSSPMFVYALAVVLAGWSTKASLVLFVAVPLFFVLPNPLLELSARQRKRPTPTNLITNLMPGNPALEVSYQELIPRSMSHQRGLFRLTSEGGDRVIIKASYERNNVESR
jgi:hypothetical protein